MNTVDDKIDTLKHPPNSTILKNNTITCKISNDIMKCYKKTSKLDLPRSISRSVTSLDNTRNINKDEEEETASYFNLMKNNRSFRLFIFSYFATMSGEWFNYIASISVIESLSPNSYVAVSTLMILRLIPNLLSIFGGSIADSFDKRQSMIKLNMVSSIIAMQFLLAYQCKSLIMIYIVTFLQSIISALYEPMRMSFIPLLVTNDEYLQKATTMTSLVWSVMAAFGAGIGGIVSAYVGVQACFLLDTSAYLVSAALLYNIAGAQIAATTTANGSLKNQPTAYYDSLLDTWSQFVSMSKDGIHYIKSSFFGPLVLVNGAAALIFGSCDVLNVTFSKVPDNPSASNARLGLLFTCVGFGCLVGPLVAENFTTMKYLRTLQYAIIVSFAFMTVSAFGMGYFDTNFICTCVFTIIRALGSSTIWVNSSILLQKFSSIDMLGRVSSVDHTIATLCEAISVMSAGILLDIFGLGPNIVCYIFSILSLIMFTFWFIFDRNGGGAASSHGLVSCYEDNDDDYISLL